MKLSTVEAMARLNVTEAEEEGAVVHTFRNPNGMLVGADWPLTEVRAAIEAHGVEESGPAATRMGHGLVLMDERGPLFLETKEAPE